MANYYLPPNKNVYRGMSDSNYSENLRTRLASTKKGVKITKDEITSDLTSTTRNQSSSTSSDMNIYDSLYHSANIRRRRQEIYGSGNGSYGNLFNKTFRFGVYNPYGAISNAREFLFFTKPDLNIYTDSDKQNPKTQNEGLSSYFWQDIYENKDRIIRCLQYSYKDKIDPFNHLLQNTVVSNLEVPSLNAPSVETSTNSYGVSLTYRGSSEESDDGPEFSLEFKDDRYLNVYSFFRAYEDYETLKKHGTIAPQKKYIMNRVIHDQFSIYKFIVDEDMETILYWGKYYGVYPTSLPRDAFNSSNFQDGLSFSINFKAAFYEDMRPEILYDFNTLGRELYNKCPYRIDIWNDVMGRTDNRAAKVAYVQKVTTDKRAQQNPNGYYYKLAWKGEDTV